MDFPFQEFAWAGRSFKSSNASFTVFCEERERIHFLRLLFQKISTASVAKGLVEQPVSLMEFHCSYVLQMSTVQLGRIFSWQSGDLYLKCSVRFLVSHILLLDSM